MPHPADQPLALRFRLRIHHFTHGDFAAELIAPDAPDELIDVSEFNIDERLPYWAELWPSARALAAELLDAPLPGGPVLELGCGIALPSLALRWRGADVVASDYYPEALEFALANAVRNDIPPPSPLLLDWRTPPADLNPFRLVLAADVLYEKRNADALAELLPRVTSHDGRVLLADPGRTHLERFRQLMLGRGWRIERTGAHTLPAPAGEGTVSVQIHTLWREAADRHCPPPKL
jgi:ETFB lysine methyltransferase